MFSLYIIMGNQTTSYYQLPITNYQLPITNQQRGAISWLLSNVEM